MARLIILAATLALLVAIANAYTYKTIVTTTVDEGINNLRQASRSCRKQIQRQDLSDCEQFLTQGSRFRSLLLMRRVLNQEPLEQCCQQLEQLDRECQSEAIDEMTRQIEQEQEEMRGEEKQEMLRRASIMASRCGVESQRRADKYTLQGNQMCAKQILSKDRDRCEKYMRMGRRSDKQQCCEQLQEFDDRCQCDGIKQTLAEVLGEGVTKEEMQLMRQRASELPSFCGVKASCGISSPRF